MAYNPHSNTSEDRFPSGIVFFGVNSTKPMLDSSSAFIIDETNNSLAIADGYYLGSQSYRQLLNLASDGTATFASGVVVEGNLTVNGDVVTVNTEQILVEDNILTLNSGNYTTPTVDAGIEIFRGTGDIMSLTWNETSDKWTFTDTSGTYDLVGAYLSQELRYKTLDGTYNTFLNIPNTALPNNGSSTVTAGTGLSNGGSFSVGGSITVDLDLHSLSEAAIENGDYIAFVDANDNSTKKESIADIAALFAGNGLTATNSVINVVGGTGITASSNSLDIDASVITSQNELSSAPDATNDYLLIYDNDTSSLKKINRTNFVSGLGTMTSFTVAGDTGTNQTISEGNTLTIAGGTGLSSVGSNTDTVTINLDNTAVNPNTYGDSNSVAQFTVDQQGRITNASNVDISLTSDKISYTVDTYTSTSNITHDVALGNTTGAITLTLPSPASGKIVRVKNINSGTVTVNSSVGNIDGTSSKILYYVNESMTFIGNGSNWFII